jgi:RNA polymerase sigma factor (sigma-70 family)
VTLMSKKNDKARIDEFLSVVEQFSQFIRVHIQKFAPQNKGIDPDDILQEVKIKIWNVLIDEKKIDNYASYIKKIVNSSVIDHLRRIRREERVLFTEMQRKISERRSTYNKENIDTDECKKILKQAVDSLLDSRRKVVKLYLLNMTLEEISEFFNWSPHKTRNLLYRGLNDLKKILQEKGIEYED